LWRWIGFGVVVLGFWAGYILVLSWRADLVDRIECVTKHGLIMVEDGGVVPSCDSVETETDRVLAAWGSVPGVSGPNVLDDGVMIFVKPLPFVLHSEGGNKFAGFAKPYSRSIAVGFDGRELSRTALGHELGHIILSGSGKRGDEQTLKDHHDRYGVPY
jgi:hypothetical protein